MRAHSGREKLTERNWDLRVVAGEWTAFFRHGILSGISLQRRTELKGDRDEIFWHYIEGEREQTIQRAFHRKLPNWQQCC